jgi:hypothetical protein
MEAAGYQVEVRQRKDDHRVSLMVKKEDAAWLCVPPPEYPLSMPRIYRLPHLAEAYPFRLNPVWNSDLCLVDCLAAVLLQEEMERAEQLQVAQVRSAVGPSELPSTDEPVENAPSAAVPTVAEVTVEKTSPATVPAEPTSAGMPSLLPASVSRVRARLQPFSRVGWLLTGFVLGIGISLTRQCH